MTWEVYSSLHVIGHHAIVEAAGLHMKALLYCMQLAAVLPRRKYDVGTVHVIHTGLFRNKRNCSRINKKFTKNK